jgi:chromosome partitioning protein
MKNVIAVANLKGGVAKTTTCLSIAGAAGRMGKKVLLVDTDPQGSLSRVAAPDQPDWMSLEQAFQQRARSLDGVRGPSRFFNVDLVRASLAFDTVLQTAVAWEGREYVLADMLLSHAGEYDLVLIDCRPAVDLSVVNALSAARWLLAPVEADFMALDGYAHVRALVERLRQRINPHLGLLGLLPTKFRSTTAHGRQALREIQQQADQDAAKLHFAPIRLSVAASDANARGLSLAQFAPNAPIAREYRCVAEHILTFLEASDEQS